jgi:hypothetical protein
MDFLGDACGITAATLSAVDGLAGRLSSRATLLYHIHPTLAFLTNSSSLTFLEETAGR